MLFKSAVVVRYFIYFDYYSEVLCENKDVPMSHCNGQCALSKELNLARQNSERAELPLEWIKEFNVSNFLVEEELNLSFTIQEFSKSQIIYLIFGESCFLDILDRPPVGS